MPNKKENGDMKSQSSRVSFMQNPGKNGRSYQYNKLYVVDGSPSSPIPTQNKRTSAILSPFIFNSIMNKSYLQNLSKSELISLLLQMNKPTPAPIMKKRVERPTPAPRKSVKQLVQAYENNIIAPPTEFQDDIIPPPPQFMDKPIPALRTKDEIGPNDRF